ncbi:uncharacterized protein V6R79_009353 [Siganus canaliculatus]
MAYINTKAPGTKKVDGDIDEDECNFEEALKNMEMWKAKAEKADDVKARLMLEKMEEDDSRTTAEREMLVYVHKQEGNQKKFSQNFNMVQDEIQKLEKSKQDLLNELRRYEFEVESQRSKSAELRQKFKISIQIPDTVVNFRYQNQNHKGEHKSINGVFAISQIPSVFLQGGQTLITFEEERVASQILKIARCSVSYEGSSMDVKPRRITVDPVVKFEVHLSVSTKKIMVSNICSSLPMERIKNQLEMSFSKPSKGGGEVVNVEYDGNTGTGEITFLHHGVAENMTQAGNYPVDLDSEEIVQIGPLYKYRLCKFQTFCGSSKRTILLDNTKDTGDEEDLQDHLEIHFQKPSNSGGEIESIKYISLTNSLQAFFICDDISKMDGKP